MKIFIVVIDSSSFGAPEYDFVYLYIFLVGTKLETDLGNVTNYRQSLMKVESLEKKNKELERTLTENQLKSERTQWSRKEKDFEKKKSELETELKDVTTKLRRAERKNDDLRLWVEKLNSNLQCVEKNAGLSEKRLELERGQRSREENNFVKEKSELEKALEDAKKECIERTERFKKKYFNKCNHLQQEIKELRNKLQCSEDEKNKLLANSEQQLKLEKENWSRKEKHFVEEKTVLKTENSQYSKKCNDLEKQIVNLKSELQRYKEERKDLVKVEDLERQKTLNEREYLKKVKDLEKKNEELETTLSDMKTKKEGAERDKAQCSFKCKMLEQQLQKLNIKFQRSEEEEKKLSRKFYDKEQQLKSERGQWSKKEEHFGREKKEREKALADIKSRLERAESEKSRYLKKCNDLKQEIAELKIKLQRS